MADGETRTITRGWTPPIWLRKLSVVAEEQRRAPFPSMSPTERFRIACDLMAFALTRLEEQAAQRGCSVSRLLVMYEQASGRLRARG